MSSLSAPGEATMAANAKDLESGATLTSIGRIGA